MKLWEHVEEFWKKVEDTTEDAIEGAKNAVRYEQRAFNPDADITAQELAYIVQYKLTDRMMLPEHWEALPDEIKRHFD